MTRKRLVTSDSVLQLLSRSESSSITRIEVGARLGVSANAAGTMLRSLLASGVLVVEKRPDGALYYSLRDRKQGPKGGLVPPRQTNIWAPPLQGYEARWRSFADRAMATRRA